MARRDAAEQLRRSSSGFDIRHSLDIRASAFVIPAAFTATGTRSVVASKTKKRYKGLVIVESPAKGKKIAQFLGGDYKVLPSMGHVRDLPASATEIPEEIKKQPWATLGVNVDAEFQPLYIVPP